MLPFPDNVNPLAPMPKAGPAVTTICCEAGDEPGCVKPSISTGTAIAGSGVSRTIVCGPGPGMRRR
jgi:hypothetical protein